MTREQKRRWISTAEAVRVAHANSEDAPSHLTTTIASNNRSITDWITINPPIADHEQQDSTASN